MVKESDFLNYSSKKQGVSESDFLNYSGVGAKTQAKTGVSESDFFKYADEQAMKQNPETVSMFDAFYRGALKSSGGAPIKAIYGLETKMPKKDEGYINHLSELAGEMIGDIPAFIAGQWVGTAAGGVIGGAIGSVVPGVGTAAGAGTGGTIGAMSGMMAAPAIIKTAFQGYEKYVAEGGEKTLGGFMSSLDVGEIAKAGGKAGAIGGIFGAIAPQMAKAVPALKKIPGMDKILNIKPIKFAAEKGTTLAALEVAKLPIEQKLPTLKEVVDDTFMLMGAYAGEKISGKVDAYRNRALSKTASSAEVRVAKSEAQLKAREAKLKIEEAAREVKTETEVKTAESVEIKTEKVDLAKEKAKIEQEGIASERKLLEVDKQKIAEVKVTEAKIEKAIRQASYDAMAEAVQKILPERFGGKKLSKYLKGLPESRAKTKKLNEILVDNYGEYSAKVVEHNIDWTQKQKTYEQKYGKMTTEQSQDLLHYMQRTGNPRIEGDTFSKLEKRITPGQKALGKESQAYFNDILKENNANPLLKKINPRDILLETYLPGYYKDAPAKIRSIYDKVSPKLKLKNPAANAKEFLTLADAMTKGGLTPQFDNVVDYIKEYGNQHAKIQANTNMLNDIRELQKTTGDDFIVHPKTDAEAEKYKELGYKVFEDPLLKAVPQSDGSFKYQSKSALVSPEFANEMRGVFTETAIKGPDHWAWRAIDNLNNKIRIARVAVSPFHYKTQLENLAGQLGMKKALKVLDVMNQGKLLSENKLEASRAARAGVQATSPESLRLNKGSGLIDSGIDVFLGKKSPTGAKAKSALNKIKRGFGYLHEEFIPNLKRVAFKEVADAQLSSFEKAHGRKAIPKEALQIERIVAEQINNVFGGQNWATSKFFKTARSRKIMRRFIAYPDWTISNIKQALGAFKPGLGGKMGQKYLAKYLLNGMFFGGAMRAFLGSIYQKDVKPREGFFPRVGDFFSSLGFDPKRGLKEIGNVKLGEGFFPMVKSMFSFKLPQIDIRYGPGKNDVVEFGRHPDGSNMVLGFGKQFTELGGYNILEPQKVITTLFNKSTPVIQEAWKQLASSTPSEFGSFTVGAKYRGAPAWQGKKGLAQVAERGKELLKSPMPFAIRGGMKQWLSSVFGSFTVSKEASLFKSTPAIESAFKDKNKKRRTKKLEAITGLLRNNQVKDSDIKEKINNVRNNSFRDKYSNKIEKLVKIKDNTKRERMIKAFKKKVAKDPLEVKEVIINNMFTSAINRLQKAGTFTKAYADELLEKKKGSRPARWW